MTDIRFVLAEVGGGVELAEAAGGVGLAQLVPTAAAGDDRKA